MKSPLFSDGNEDNHRTPTVFLVDEDEASTASLREVVASMQYQFESFHSGQEFLDALDPEQPGCLIVEVRLRGVSGLQLQRSLAARDVTLPVIFLTAHADVPTAVRAMRAGAIHFLEKPFREADLWDAVHEAVTLDATRRRGIAHRRFLEERLGRLTAKQEELLELILQGKPTRAIAAELSVSVRTVELRRAKLMEKMEVETLPALLQVALATRELRAQPAEAASLAGYA